MTKNSKEELDTLDKILIFFFGIIFVMIVGYQYFYNLQGSNKKKKQGLILYYSGILFWISILVIVSIS